MSGCGLRVAGCGLRFEGWGLRGGWNRACDMAKLLVDGGDLRRGVEELFHGLDDHRAKHRDLLEF